MIATSVDEVAAEAGEASFILQIRPPAGGQEAALATALDQFLALYLAKAEPSEGRFGRLDTLTWALSAPMGDSPAIVQLSEDLAEAVFGDRTAPNVCLHAEAADPEPVEDDVDAFEVEPEAGADAPVELPDVDQALDIDHDIVLTDDPALAAREPDDWAPNNAPMTADHDPAEAFEPSSDIDAPDVDETWSANTPIEGALDAFSFAEAPEPADGPSEFEVLAAAMAETPPETHDLAAELAAFREEMRAIAGAIPQPASGEDALANFRAELEGLSGALGQRVDGAAQRIETAADRVAQAASAAPDIGRMTELVERAERSAGLMETSVKEAVTVLLKACEAMGAEPEASVFDVEPQG